jgi:cobalt-zinc-cadmium efflux system protein
VTLTIMVVEIVGGVLSNSLALLSDAGHMLTDLLALLLSLVALQFAARPPSSTKTYGFYRMEILAALVNGTGLVLISAVILYEAYHRLRTAETVDVPTMLWVATVGLVANGLAAIAMTKASGESLNIRGAYLHILGDALSSFGVILGGAIILFTGWYAVDPVISVIICAVILRGAFALVKDSVNILLEAAPKDVDLGEVRGVLGAIPGVKELHDLHLWTISSGIYAMSAHVLVDDILMSRTGEILQKITHVLKEQYGIVHTTIQFECENCEEGMYCDANGVCLAVTRAHSHEY